MASEKQKRAYLAQRVAAAAGLETLTNTLCEIMDAQGGSMADLVGTSHRHNGALEFTKDGVSVFVPVILTVGYGVPLSKEEFDTFCAQDDWNKSITVLNKDGKEEEEDATDTN